MGDITEQDHTNLQYGRILILQIMQKIDSVTFTAENLGLCVIVAGSQVLSL
jgi:hypothetical protein